MQLRKKFFVPILSRADGTYVIAVFPNTSTRKYVLATDAITPGTSLATSSAAAWALGNSTFSILGPSSQTAGVNTVRYNFGPATSVAGPNVTRSGGGTVGGAACANAFVGIVALATGSAYYGTTNRIVFANYVFVESTNLGTTSSNAIPGTAVGDASVAIINTQYVTRNLTKYVYATEAAAPTTSLTNTQSGRVATSITSAAYGVILTSATNGRATERYTFASDTVAAGITLLGTDPGLAGSGNSTVGLITALSTTARTNKYQYSPETVTFGLALGASQVASSVICNGTQGVNV